VTDDLLDLDLVGGLLLLALPMLVLLRAFDALGSLAKVILRLCSSSDLLELELDLVLVGGLLLLVLPMLLTLLLLRALGALGSLAKVILRLCSSSTAVLDFVLSLIFFCCFETLLLRLGALLFLVLLLLLGLGLLLELLLLSSSSDWVVAIV